MCYYFTLLSSFSRSSPFLSGDPTCIRRFWLIDDHWLGFIRGDEEDLVSSSAGLRSGWFQFLQGEMSHIVAQDAEGGSS